MKLLQSYSMGVILSAGLLTTSAVLADNPFYCGTHIISSGLSKSEVLKYCGNPSKKYADQWFYDRGPQALLIELHFDANDVLERITKTARDEVVD